MNQTFADIEPEIRRMRGSRCVAELRRLFEAEHARGSRLPKEKWKSLVAKAFCNVERNRVVGSHAKLGPAGLVLMPPSDEMVRGLAKGIIEHERREAKRNARKKKNKGSLE